MEVPDTERSSINLRINKRDEVEAYVDDIVSAFHEHPIIKLTSIGSVIPKAIRIASAVMQSNKDIVYRALSDTIEFPIGYFRNPYPNNKPKRMSRLTIILTNSSLANEHYRRPEMTSSISGSLGLI